MKKCLFIFTLFTLLACKKEESETHTNIVLIVVDDLGYGDLASYGSPLNETPNLDQMAREGSKFTSFYAAQAVCSASRAAILTGCYPNRLGINGALMPDSEIGLNPSELTIADMLKPEGYTSAIFGKWHLGDHPQFLPLNQGFDEYVGIPYSNDMWPLHPQQGPVFNFGPLPLIRQDAVVDTLEDQTNLTADLTHLATDFIKRKKQKPFFLYLAHPQPHVPLFVSDQFKGKSHNGLYGDVIMEIDWSVGQILSTLKEEKLDQNTLVIFTSDNGPWLAYGNHAGSSGSLREGKGTAWEGGQREPFIARWPGQIPAGEIVDTPLFAIDLLPTIAEITGSELPPLKIDGIGSLSLLKGESAVSPHEAFYYYYKTNELHAIRYDDWKMVFPHNYRSMKGQKMGEDGLPGNYTHLDITKPELYNLVENRSEQTNVYDEYPSMVAKFERLASDIRQDLGDQLMGLEGSGRRKPGRVEKIR